ncbi:MAG: malate dehydrogenase [Bdellovibrionaceae bacterium]|nr:malate dehydrogenase [Bdellovibrionales bacterium]MCB9254695.1 malate dehydrogenase [Pseudobdellovibrionaceae bacterium]
MKRPKITIVGSGNVGATAAHWIVSKELGDVVLVDIAEGIPQGKGLDLLEAGPVEGFDCHVTGTNDYAATENSDVVVITAGLPRKPGMSRDDLLKTNAKIMTQVTEQVAKYSPNSVLIIVSNPLDAMAYVAKKVSGFPRQRVIGMAGVLDSARFRTFVAEATGVSVEDVHGFVYGGHGDTMVPMVRYCSIAGVPLTKFLSQEKIDAIVDRTRKGGLEIVNYLKTGSAFYAPSSSVVQMVEAIVRDKKRILPCAVWLEGEYGMNNLFVGVLAQLGTNGMEKVIQIDLNEQEKAGLAESAEAVKGLIAALENN